MPGLLKIDGLLATLLFGKWILLLARLLLFSNGREQKLRVQVLLSTLALLLEMCCFCLLAQFRVLFNPYVTLG